MGLFVTGGDNPLGYVHIVCDNKPPYGWFWFTHATVSQAGNPRGIWTALVCDPVTDHAPEDDDPYIFYRLGGGAGNQFQTGSMSISTIVTSTQASCWAWLGKAPYASAFVNLAASVYRLTGFTGLLTPNTTTPTNAFSNKDEMFAPVYYRPSQRSAPVGYKGRGTLFRWQGPARGPNLSRVENRLSVGKIGDRICLGHTTLPWDGTAVP